jgi:hypothetical protein
MLMQRFTRLVAVAVLAASSAASVRGEDSLLFENENRFYLAPIVGASWGTLINHEIPEPGEPREPGQTVMEGNLFTAGGGAGGARAPAVSGVNCGSSSRAATATTSASREISELPVYPCRPPTTGQPWPTHGGTSRSPTGSESTPVAVSERAVTD